MPNGSVTVRDASNTIFSVETRTDVDLGVELQLIGMDPLAQADGHSVTLGTKADTAWSGTGSGSLVALLKDIATHLRGTVATSIAGSVGITGNVATTQAAASQADGHSATIGAIADAAWAGSGSGTLVAILKALWTSVQALGATADVAVTTNAVGTISAKLRGLLAIHSDMWSSSQHAGRVVNPDDSLIGAIQLVSATGTVTTVASSATVVTLKALNLDRMGLMIYNSSTSRLFIKFGAAASLTDYSFVLAPLDSSAVGDFWEHPQGYVYTGIVTGIWASANGSAQITEFTA